MIFAVLDTNALVSALLTKNDFAATYQLMPDEDDRVFYEVALSKEDAYHVTGNSKHFPVTPIVVTPAEMLDILSKQK